MKGFPGGAAGKESPCNAGYLGSIPGLGRSPGEGKGYLLQYSGLENSIDCIVHGFTKSWHNWATLTNVKVFYNEHESVIRKKEKKKKQMFQLSKPTDLEKTE